jgi:hypothetical protein
MKIDWSVRIVQIIQINFDYVSWSVGDWVGRGISNNQSLSYPLSLYLNRREQPGNIDIPRVPYLLPVMATYI